MRRPGSTLASPTLSIHSVQAVTILNKNSLFIEITLEGKKNVETLALIDSGAGGKFIDQNFVRKERFEMKDLENPLVVYNVDGTLNKTGTIRKYIDLSMIINGRKTMERLLVTGLGKLKIILGFPWLNEQNPVIDWKLGMVSFPEKRKINWKQIIGSKSPKASLEEEVDEEDWKNRTINRLEEEETSLLVATLMGQIDTDIWINAKTNLAMDMAIEANLKKKEIPVTELVPPEYHELLDVFDEDKANRFPESRKWDHKIDMKEGFEPKAFKNYNLTPEEQVELDTFLKENLEKGYIRQSESPMASPFFFVKKKDGKLRPCQDYRYLNNWTVKNAYPLPLISDIMDRLKGAKYFMKFDVRWGYNNIRIRKGDEWKAVFKTNRGLYEPTVMFFGMCNSPATFQAMMDRTFEDIVEEGFVLIYMDDILIFA